MALLELRGGGGYLYQVRPDIFPEGYLTTTELELWSLYYEDRDKKRKARGK